MNAANPELLSDPAAWATDVMARAYNAIQAFLPDLLLAGIVLLGGWLGAWAIRLIILRFGSGLDTLLSTLNQTPAATTQRFRWSIAAIVGNVAFWIVIAAALVSASETLGLRLLAGWLNELLSYLPRLLISGAILFIGYLVSRGLRDLILGFSGARNLQHGVLLGETASGLVLAFALLLALDQLGLDVDLLKNIIVLAFAAFFGGTALAFGIGAADAVRNIMASHYLRRMYQPGLLVQVGDREGEILELTAVGVLLETENGQAFIPARVFLESGSMILEPEDDDGT